MLVIVDANTWASVFLTESQDHKNFEVIANSINTGQCKVAWGGTKYFKELEAAPKYLRVHLELQKGGRAQKFPDPPIDEVETRLNQECVHRDFDDAHIVALQIVSKAEVICSCDSRAYPFYKRKELYPKKHIRPRIYHSDKNAELFKCGVQKRRNRTTK